MLEIIRRNIEKNITAFIDKADKQYQISEIHPFLAKNLKEYSKRQGKRVRPLLFILCYKAYQPKSHKIHPSLYSVATAIEFLHNFMLIHDDIIDNSLLRRGKETLHHTLRNTIKGRRDRELGNNLGIIAGDIIFALSIECFLQIRENPERKEKALKYFIQTTTTTALGEFIDTVHGLEPLKKIKEKDVFLNYTLKTARYTFENPLIIGAILAGASQQETQKLKEFALLCGQAFQIQDDIIGIYGAEKEIGKSILSDLAESKKTLLIIHAFEHLKGKEKQSLITIFNKKTKNLTDLKALRSLLIKSSSLDYCLRQTELRLLAANEILENLQMNAPYKKHLKALLSKLFHPIENLT